MNACKVFQKRWNIKEKVPLWLLPQPFPPEVTDVNSSVETCPTSIHACVDTHVYIDWYIVFKKKNRRDHTMCMFLWLAFFRLPMCLGVLSAPAYSDPPYSLWQLGNIPLHQHTAIYRPTPLLQGIYVISNVSLMWSVYHCPLVPELLWARFTHMKW